MGFTNSPNGLTSFGIPVIGGLLPIIDGTYWFVSSVTGSSGNEGIDLSAPLATIDHAINKGAAGDVIILLPGHAETISGATSLVMDVAGIQIIGLGVGSRRPTLTFSATDSILNVTAADVLLENVLIVGAIDDLVTGIALSAVADGFTLRNVEVRDSATDEEFLIFMTIAALCSNVTIDGLKFRGLGGGMTDCIVAAGAADGFTLKNSSIYCDASDKVVDLTAAASVGVDILNNRIINIDTTAGLGVAIHNSSNGYVDGNRVTNLKDTVVGITGTGMAYGENLMSNALNASGIILPAVDS